MRFRDFLTDDNQVFILKGYAGTGKTTIVKEMIDLLETENLHFKLLASTGRAAKILANATDYCPVKVLAVFLFCWNRIVYTYYINYRLALQ